jgi:chaperonin GroES
MRDNGGDAERSSRWSATFQLEKRMTTPTLKPLADRVIVERTTPQEKTAGGIVLPDTVKDKPREGTVIAAGPGPYQKDGKRRPLDVHEGDRILFGSYAGNEIKLDGKEYLILKEEEILAIVSN